MSSGAAGRSGQSFLHCGLEEKDGRMGKCDRKNREAEIGKEIGGSRNE
ncbi:MAG: hypothetical protein HFI50_07510 [Lachnospiraceae bacterium]|jgi:hypothetical protein|nr:hypothetical protein [Lachnospiraceae bacterium]